MSRQIFTQFARELDDHNDRRERLIKASRDVTNLSKKTIFLLHRLVFEEPFDDQSPPPAIRAAICAKERLLEVQNMYAAMAPELQGDRFWRYHYQVSPGLQEYIEALGFAHYLEHGTLITFDQVQQSLSGPDGVPYFPLPLDDYFLGLSDLTGELMRYAISAISRRGGRALATQICAFVRACKADFEGMTPYIRNLTKKQHVTSQSLEKIEDAAYAIAIRSSEYDLPQDMLYDIVAQSISGFDASGPGMAHTDDKEDQDNHLEP